MNGSIHQERNQKFLTISRAAVRAEGSKEVLRDLLHGMANREDLAWKCIGHSYSLKFYLYNNAPGAGKEL
jgi:hypothetical protein